MSVLSGSVLATESVAPVNVALAQVALEAGDVLAAVVMAVAYSVPKNNAVAVIAEEVVLTAVTFRLAAAA